MKEYSYSEHTLNNHVSKVLFRTSDWVVVEFQGHPSRSIWMAHHCNDSVINNRENLSLYKWLHMTGLKDAQCNRCKDLIPEPIKTIYVLLEAGGDT